jgi:hypothetical protein
LLVLAIYNLKGNQALLARQLAAILHRTIYEAGSRVRAPGGGPSVIASFAEPRAAREAAAALEAGGFDVLLLDAGDVERDERRFVVWRFELGDEGMSVEARTTPAAARTAARPALGPAAAVPAAAGMPPIGSALAVPYASIDLLVRGVRIVTRRPAVPATTRRISLTRAALTGGLVLTKAVTAARQPASEEREGFLHLYGQGLPPLVWREAELDYRSLGEALQPSRHANFAQLAGELRRRCPRATWDERLATCAGQAQLLGAALSPAEHLDVAISVLALVLRGPPARTEGGGGPGRTPNGSAGSSFARPI